jgi:hypothetical protein
MSDSLLGLFAASGRALFVLHPHLCEAVRRSMKSFPMILTVRHFLRRPAPSLLAGFVVVLASCTGSTAPTKSQTAEATLTEQVGAVRAGDSHEIRVELASVGDAGLAQVHDLPGLRRLILDRAAVTDAGIVQLKNLPALEEVRILGGHIGDAGLAHLCGFPTIERLNLPDTGVTDQGLAALSQLPGLVQLRLGSRKITDAGMDHVAALKQLRFLHLINLRLTDAGILKLQQMTSLESLYLDGVNDVTDQGLDRLLKALPGVHFHRDQQHLPGDPHDDGHERGER